MAAVRLRLARMRERVDQQQFAVRATAEDVTLVSQRDDRGMEFGVAGGDVELAITRGDRRPGSRPTAT